MAELKILVIGGTGFIGSTLCGILLAGGHRVSVMSRGPTPASFPGRNISVLQADVSRPGPWQDEIPEYEIVINLTGASIFRRWTGRGKREIINSRILNTQNIIEAIKKQRGKVKTFISVSGVGYYGFHGEETLSEDNPAGPDFIAQVAARWEAAAGMYRDLGVRIVICRFGHVLGLHGGPLPKLITLAKLHLGSYWGSGKQWISWIHEKDLARAILFLISFQAINGPVNITSPNPARNREMMQIISKTSGSRVLIPPVPEIVLRLLLGQFSSVFVNGQKVIPQVLQENGFVFEFPCLNNALSDLLKPRHQDI
jgi:uncharacterized protein